MNKDNRESYDGKLASFSPIAKFSPPLSSEPFQEFSFDDETIGIILESFYYEETKDHPMIWEFLVLVEDREYTYTFVEGDILEFNILEN